MRAFAIGPGDFEGEPVLWAALAGPVGADVDNLHDAIDGESYEVETMYRNFAEQAGAAGDRAVADRFAEIRQDEMKHRDAFKTALVNLSRNPTRGW